MNFCFKKNSQRTIGVYFRFPLVAVFGFVFDQHPEMRTCSEKIIQTKNSLEEGGGQLC